MCGFFRSSVQVSTRTGSSHSVTLRCEPRSGKPRRATAPFFRAAHPSRLATLRSLAPQDDGLKYTHASAPLFFATRGASFLWFSSGQNPRGAAPLSIPAIDAGGAGAESNHIEEAAGHDEVLVKIDHVRQVSDGQMYGEGRPKAEQGKQSGRPARLEADQHGQAAEKMNQDRYP